MKVSTWLSMELECWVAVSFGDHHVLWPSRSLPVTRSGLWHLPILQASRQRPWRIRARPCRRCTCRDPSAGALRRSVGAPHSPRQFLSLLTPPRSPGDPTFQGRALSCPWWITRRRGTPREGGKNEGPGLQGRHRPAAGRAKTAAWAPSRGRQAGPQML